MKKLFLITAIALVSIACSARHEAYRALRQYDELQVQYPVSAVQPEEVAAQKIYTLGEALSVSLEAIKQDPSDARAYRTMYESYYALDALNVRDEVIAEMIERHTQNAYDRFTLAPEHKYFCYQNAKMLLAQDKIDRMRYQEVVRCSQRKGVAGMMEKEILEFVTILNSLEYIYNPSNKEGSP